MNEPLRYPTDLERDHGTEMARFAGNEHVYSFPEYLWMTWRAGFHHIHIIEPADDVRTDQRFATDFAAHQA